MSPPPDSSEGARLDTGRPTTALSAATTEAVTSVLPSRADVLRDARDRRDLGAALADEASGEWWRSTADRAIAAMAALGRPFTADNLVEHTGLPEAASPRAMGARFLTAARHGVIEPVGYTTSRRPSARMAVVRVWQGVRPAVDPRVDRLGAGA